MSEEYALQISDEQLTRVLRSLKSHTCRFDETEARQMHEFARIMDNGGMDKFREVIAFGGTIQQFKKAGFVAFVVALVGAVIGILWMGFLRAIEKGGIK